MEKQNLHWYEQHVSHDEGRVIEPTE
jgi:hypothetical protein